jgi:GAF domain-containing protein
MGYVKIVRNFKTEGKSLDPFARPANDAQRVEALHKLKIMNTSSEEIFSLYTELAARMFMTPIALISFVDEDTVFYKESFGVNRTGELVARKNSPCTLAILNDEITLLRYALSDPCILADTKNLEEAGYKFYAGAPLKTPDNFNIGMFAVVDKKSREYSDEQLVQLRVLATEVMNEISLRLTDQNSKKPDVNARLKALRSRIETLK